MASQVYSDPSLAKREEIAQKKLRLAQIKMQYHGFAVFTLTRLINEIIIDPIQRQMESRNYDRKIIERTYLDSKVEGKGRGTQVTFHVKSDYISETMFPVAVMMEKGRKAYSVKAPEPSPDRPNPHLKFIIDGETKYRKKVKIPRKEGSHIIRDTIRRQKQVLGLRFKQAEKDWFNSILKS